MAEKRIRGVAESPYRMQTWENTDASLPGERDGPEYTITSSEPVRLLKITLDWATPDDYDLEVYLKQPDGTLKNMGGSGGPPGAKETAFIEDAPAGTYVLRVVNFAAVNPAWTLKAEEFGPGPGHRDRRRQGSVAADLPHGTEMKSQKVYVDRARRERRRSLPLMGYRSGYTRLEGLRALP